jgi:hypothetical protein
MDQLNPERRGMFGGLRVPFDLNMLALALGAVVATWASTELVEAVTGDADVLSTMHYRLRTGGYGGREALKPVTWFLECGILLALWGFFSAAISRIAAMKIAREETVDVRDAARFAAKKFVPVVSSVLFVATIVLFFYLVCNATLAGFAMRLPGLDVVVSLLFFTVLLSTFFIVFSLVLGLFGMNLAAAAIATESSDTWDGISRAWNYILVRPWHVLLSYALTAAYLFVFFFFSEKFLVWSVSTLAIGPYGLGERPVIVEAARADVPNFLQSRFPENVQTAKFLIPGKGEYIMNSALGTWKGESIEYWLSAPNQKWFAEYKKGLSADALSEIKNPEGGVDIAPLIPATWKLSGAIVWFWLWLAKIAIFAYALQYFFAATTKLYFLLRKEVEDEDYGEIVVEEEELEEEAAWDVKEPQKPVQPATGAAPAGHLIMPKALGGSPAAGGAAPASGAAPAPASSGQAPAPAGGTANGGGSAPAAPAPAPAAPTAASGGEKKA